MCKELMLRLRFRSIESALMVLLAVGAMGFNDCCGDPNHNLPPGIEGADCRAYDSGMPLPQNACDPGLYCAPTHNSYGCFKCPCDTNPGFCGTWCKGLPPGTLGAPCRATEAGPTANACDPGLHCAPILGVCQTCACWRYDPLPPTCYEWCKVDARVESSVPKGDVARPDVARPDLSRPDVVKPKPDVRLDVPKADTCAGKICYGACVDTTTDPANCGTCGTACKAGYQQCTNSTCTVGCASSTGVIQVFTGGMYGCAGTVTWANRATLCTAGYHVCSAAEWIAKRGTIAPSASYWTGDDLKYNGGSFVGCYASLTTGTACTAGRPMRVCMGASDPKGNTCQYFGCGFNTPTPNQYFGGCNNDPTAGTLCCK